MFGYPVSQYIQTDDMFSYAFRASRGDDVYEEDVTTNEFEAKLAALTGKQDALFCISGTMANQIGLRTSLQQPPHSVICDSRAHIYRFEAGGVAYHSQAQTIPVTPSNGHHLTLEDIQKAAVIDENIHYATTRVIALENATGGLIYPQEEIKRISEWAHTNGLFMHLDGARLWNAHIATGLSVNELCEPFDSVSVCLSKGLGAPIGSILVGSKSFIKKATWFRKLLGGGVRQCGFVVAAADYALQHNLPLIKRSHQLAKRLSIGLENAGVKILSPVESSMIFYDPTTLGISSQEFDTRAKVAGITLRPGRIVLHFQNTDEAIDKLVAVAESFRKQH